MERVMLELEGKKCWKSFLKGHCCKNKITPTLVGSFTVIKFRKFHRKIINMEGTNKPRTKSSVWLQNELKAYQWFLLAYAACRGILIEQCSEDEWRELSTIFCKEESILEYEAVKLVKQRSMAKRPWEREESALLQAIIRQKMKKSREDGSNKWNEMARRLFAQSNRRFFRSGKQCRQRWYNHLDPNKKHGQWESTEDRKIATHILRRGARWSEIAKALGRQRTQHMVKNRLKTILIKLRRKYGEEEENETLLQRFVNDMGEIEESESVASTVREGNQRQLPVKISSNSSYDYDKMSDDNEDGDDYFLDGLPEFQFHRPATPNALLPPLTPTFLNTPNSLTFLVNYSFDNYEQHQNLFLTNS